MPTADMNRRMAAVLCTPTNQVCADCPAKRPLWASFMISPVEEDRRIGILICSNCAQHHHFEFGEPKTFIKYLKMAHEWEEEDIEMMEEGGNEFVNLVFEAELTTDDFDKNKVEDDEGVEEKRRGKFIKKKYKKLKYFDEVVYHQQILKLLQKKHELRKQRKADEEARRNNKRSDSEGDLSQDSGGTKSHSLKESRARLRGHSSSGDLRSSSHSRSHSRSPKRSSMESDHGSGSSSRPQMMKKSYSMRSLGSDKRNTPPRTSSFGSHRGKRSSDRDRSRDSSRRGSRSHDNNKDERRNSGSSFGDSSNRSHSSHKRSHRGSDRSLRSSADDRRESSSRSARSSVGAPQ